MMGPEFSPNGIATVNLKTLIEKIKTPEQEYDEALMKRDYVSAIRLYKDQLVMNGWTNKRYVREGYKCGAYDEGERALIEEIIPGIERAIDKFFK